MAMKKYAFAVTSAVVLAALAGAVSATPSSGIITAPIVARSAFLDRVNLRFAIKDDHHGREIIQVHNAQDAAMQQIVFAPGGQTGWHTHPGPAVALIKGGQLTLYSGDDPTCTGRVFRAGEAFIDSGQGHVHLARNESATENAEVWVTYFDVPIGSNVRLDAASPGNCPF